MPRPCIDGCGRITDGTRCRRCTRSKDRTRNRASYYTTTEWRRLRRSIPNDCAVCGSTRRVTAHHKTPRAEGGADTRENLVALCASCHSTYEAQRRAGRTGGLVSLVDAL